MGSLLAIVVALTLATSTDAGVRKTCKTACRYYVNVCATRTARPGRCRKDLQRQCRRQSGFCGAFVRERDRTVRINTGFLFAELTQLAIDVRNGPEIQITVTAIDTKFQCSSSVALVQGTRQVAGFTFPPDPPGPDEAFITPDFCETWIADTVHAVTIKYLPTWFRASDPFTLVWGGVAIDVP